MSEKNMQPQSATDPRCTAYATYSNWDLTFKKSVGPPRDNVQRRTKYDDAIGPLQIQARSPDSGRYQEYEHVRIFVELVDNPHPYRPY
jgi:hypothetical protein